MSKILVIGCPGSGKSTFSRALHRATDIPLFHLDQLFWNADKTTVEKDVFLSRLTEVLEKDAWILDGNYVSTLSLRLQACDTVVFLDIPTECCLAGVRERRGKPRGDLPWVEEDEDAVFMDFIRQFDTQTKPLVTALLAEHADKTIYIFKTREEANAFLEKGTITW